MLADRAVRGRSRAAALALVVPAIGFGVGAVLTQGHLGRTGELPMTPWGFRAFDGGPFRALQPGMFAALLWAVAGTCLLDVIAGAWLWQGRRRGAALGLVLTPARLVLAIGFALPLLLLAIPLQVALTFLTERAPGRGRSAGVSPGNV